MLRTVDAPHGIQMVRGMLQYYGAIRTGRWAGRLIQLQNLPKGTIKNIDLFVRLIERGLGLDDLAPFAGGLDIVSSALRSCITARAGHSLFVADFAQIEARVLAWLAGQDDMLDVFRCGIDPYIFAAGQQGSTNRNFGKVLVLALGFGMGWEKFMRVALGYGIVLTEAEAVAAVRIWRKANHNIVYFWRACDRAIAAAARAPGIPVRVGALIFKLWQGHLVVRLPSGRCLIYREVEVIRDPNRPPGEDFVTIYFSGINQYTRKWERVRTWGAKVGENVTQAIARDIMAEAAAHAVFDDGLPLCLMVHDELIGEAEGDGAAALDRLLDRMRTPPAWCADLPVAAVGWTGKRYRK
jgi:DNA polymerase